MILTILTLVYSISFIISLVLLLNNVYDNCCRLNDIINILYDCMSIDYFLKGTVLGKIILIISWFCCLPWIALWMLFGIMAVGLKYILDGFVKLCGWSDKED